MSTPQDETRGTERVPNQSWARLHKQFLVIVGAVLAMLLLVVGPAVAIVLSRTPWDEHAKAACQKVEEIREHSQLKCNLGITCWVDWSDERIYKEQEAAVAEASKSTVTQLAMAAVDHATPIAFGDVEDFCDPAD